MEHVFFLKLRLFEIFKKTIFWHIFSVELALLKGELGLLAASVKTMA